MGAVTWAFVVVIWVAFSIIRKKKQLEEQNKEHTRQPRQIPGSVVPAPPRPVRKETIPNVPNQAKMPQHMETRMQSASERADIQGARVKMKTEGDKTVALRLMEGDTAPKGYRRAVCTYCGAENLIPAYQSGKYICYFCHTDIR